MRKIKIVFLQLCVIAFFSSCTKDSTTETNQENLNIEDHNSQTITSAKLKQQIAYKQHHLKNLGNWLIKNNDEVLKLIALDNIDNLDYHTVYVSHLMDNVNNEKSELLQKSMEAFLGLEDEDWYPTVTLITPNALLQPRKSGNNTIIAIEDFVDGEQIYKGYEEDEYGDLELVHEELAEEVHGNNTIFLIDISDEDSGSSGGSGNNQPINWRLKIDKMTVKHHKEGWPGRSEINFKGYKLSSLPQNSGDCGDLITGTSNCYTYSGKSIKQFKRSWIRDEDQKNIQYVMKEDTNLNNNDFVFFRIFESDSWPAPKKGKVTDTNEAFYFPNNEYRLIEYRSWQSAYDSQLLSQNANNAYGLPHTNNFMINKSIIKYNLIRNAN